MMPAFQLAILAVLCKTGCVFSMGADQNDSFSFLAYEKLHQNISTRPAVVNKIPPAVEKTDNATNIYALDLLLLPIDILSIDEIYQKVTIIAYLSVLWQHPGLSWEPADYDGIQAVHVDAESLWKPQIVITVSASESLTLTFPGELRISSSGQVASSKYYQLSFRCEIDFYKYPFDTQTCFLGFYPWQEKQLAYMESIPAPQIPKKLYAINGEWRLLNMTVEMVEDQNLVFISKFPRYSFTMQRESTYYVVTIIFPMVLTSAMIPLVFLIPPRTGEKISYLVAIFTSTAIFLNFICDVMPRGLSGVPVLAILLVEVMAEGFMATLAALVVVSRFEQEQNQKNLKTKDSDVRNMIKMTSSVSPAPTPSDEKIVEKPADNCLVRFRSTKELSSKTLDNFFLFFFVIVQGVLLLIIFLLF